MREMTISKRYKITSLIGQGGMADVYLAYDSILKRDVAIKLLRESLADDPVHVERFRREASVVASISHPNIIEIYDFGEDHNQYYIAMEYVPGQTLKDLIIIRNHLSNEEAINIMKQIVSGVACAHEHGVIHRDLKPQNILVTNSGVAKIGDFGIASISALTKVTQGDTIMGSLHYISPEIAKGEQATNQSDIYSLGIMFYEMLTGKVPFNGDSPVNIALKHMREPIPLVQDVNPLVYNSMENIIKKACAKSLDDRYSSVKKMEEDLEHYYENKDEPLIEEDEEMDDPTIIASSQDLYDIKPKPNKFKYIIAILLGLLLIAGGFLVYASGIFKDEDANKIKIPELVGLTESEAIELLEEYDLVLKFEESLSEEFETGYVFKTYPKEHKLVEKGSELVLTVSSGKYLYMEDYVGRNIDEVYNELSTLGFYVNVMNIEDDTKKAGTIVEQSVEPDTKIDPNRKNLSIRLKVVASYKYVMENFYNCDIQTAKALLEQKGLVVEFQELEASNENFELDKVIEQSIDVGTTITTKNTKVVLSYYSKYKEVVEEPAVDEIVEEVNP